MRTVLDESGAVINQTDYEPFGATVAVTGIDTRKKFIDKELDRESTTYNTGVRQYDPEGPGFASVDPLWEEFRAWTPYHYAHDNPVGLKDPSGLQVGEKNDNGGGGAISPAGGSVAPEGYWSVRPVFRGLSRFWRNLTGTNSGGGSATTATGGASSGGSARGGRGAINTPKRLNPGINVSTERMQHVRERHIENNIPAFQGKSKFAPNVNVGKLIQQGTQMPMVRQANGNFARTFDAGRVIGTDRATGQATPIVTIITTPNGNLVTMFPGIP